MIPFIEVSKFFFPTPFPLGGLREGLPMHPFGILLFTAVLVSLRAGDWYIRRHRIQPKVALDLAIHAVVVGWIGAVLFNVAAYYPERIAEAVEDIRKVPRLFAGISSYGGFLGGALGAILWSRRRKLPLLEPADAALFAIPFGHFFGRGGCALVHDHPGSLTSFFLAVQDFRGTGYTRHDLGLYEVFWCAVVSGLLLFLVRKKRPPGFYVALVPILYAPFRFFLDFLRLDRGTFGGDARYAGLTPGQYASILILLLALGVMRRVMTQPAERLPARLRVAPAPAY